MQLFMSAASPFVRKVRVAAAERGLFEMLETVLVDPHSRRQDLVEANPLSRVPTLVTDTGEVHCDSLTMCLLLDTMGDAPPMLPESRDDRFATLLRHDWADGAAEALVTCRMESLKSDVPDRLTWVARQKDTVGRVFDRFETIVDEHRDRVALDTIALACVLTYSDFRFPEDDWRTGRPRLTAWLENFSTRPSMRMTEYAT